MWKIYSVSSHSLRVGIFSSHSLTNFFFFMLFNSFFSFIFNSQYFHIFCLKHSHLDGIFRCRRRRKKCRRMLNRGSIKRNSPKDLKKVILNEEFPFLPFLIVFLLVSIKHEKFPMLINVRKPTRMETLLKIYYTIASRNQTFYQN